VIGVRQGALFEGVGVALVTLFDDDLGLDAAATADLAAQLVELGVRAVVVAGTNGEAASLSPEERARLLEAVRRAVPAGSGVPVIAGAPSAHQATRLTAAARDGGADAALALSPPGAADPRPYYDAVAAAAGAMPVLAYHFPRVSAPGIAVEDLADLPVVGQKDSSGDPDRLLDTLTTWDRPVYSGANAMIAYAGALGCAGMILGLANAEPEACVAAFAGDIGAQLKLAAAHRTERGRFPGGIKGLVAARFGCSPAARLG
jgi:dihydrodipicolinate synthase/N-acetylneuraminate lyase